MPSENFNSFGRPFYYHWPSVRRGGAPCARLHVDPSESTALRLGTATTLNEAAPDTSDETSTYLQAFKMEGAPDEVLIFDGRRRSSTGRDHAEG